MANRVGDWLTLVIMVACYGLWALATTVLSALWLPAGMLLTIPMITLFSSLQHEVLHGHPFRSRGLNQLLVFPSLTLFVPYLRFRDQHLDHHRNSKLTDPYDDPESNYLDPAVWHRLPDVTQVLLRFNNTLIGRLIVGPAVSMVSFITADARAIRAGDRAVLAGWLWHIPSLALVGLWLGAVGSMPAWAYVTSAYAGFSILKIRTFLEHRAHEDLPGRSVIIDGPGILTLLFLNNNLHAVHHANPTVSWFRLPGVFRRDRDQYLQINQGYYYRSYVEVFRKHFWRAKDPVPHPLWPRN